MTELENYFSKDEDGIPGVGYWEDSLSRIT